MEHKVPRWEWRAFSPTLEDGRIRKHKAESEQERSDLVILSELSNELIMIRDDVLRIKSPVRSSADGLQQWLTVLRMDYPLHETELALLYKFLGLPLPILERHEYAYQTLLDDLIKPCGWLSLARVETKRVRREIQEATVDVSEVSVAGIETRSISIRHSDPAVLSQLVRDLGLGDYKCESLIHAVKRVMDVPWFFSELA